MNRRFPLVLSIAAIASLTVGCTTFSDSSNIARVGDATLTSDDFQAQLTELGAPSDQPLPAEAVRAQITTWIQEQVAADDTGGVDADEAAAIYDAGIESSGTMCISGIVVESNDTATRVAGELASGADFDALFAAENVDPALANGDIGCITSEQIAGAAALELREVATSLSADNRFGVAPLVDNEGNELAWIVLSFQPFAELDPANADTVTATIDSATRLATADVFVDPRYGTFDATTGQVVALG